MRTRTAIALSAILLLCLGVGCRQDYHADPPRTVVIEGCEYFRLPAYGCNLDGCNFETLCHKGNCTNHADKTRTP